MEKYQFTDPLSSDRTLNTSRIEMIGNDTDHNLNDNSLSLYDAFSFSRDASTKIASQRPTGRLRNLKGNLTIKNNNIFELMKMLALCENRYKTEVNKLTKSISKELYLNNLGLVGLIAMIKPVIKRAMRSLKSTYLYRWKANAGFQLVIRAKVSRKAYVKTFFNACRKLFRRKMIKTFIEVRERANLIDKINRRKPSIKSPSDIRISLSPAKSISSMSIHSDRQIDDKTKKEFKQSIQNKYKPENKPLEKAMGASYFRNK
jgi:hypothetical protein